MQNFVYQNSTKLIFGRGAEGEAGRETAAVLRTLGAGPQGRILLHHSGGFAARSGLIDRIKGSLREAGVGWVELTGVKPNPRLSLVREGIALCRKEGLPFILAVGGGSAIDSAKAIAAGVPYGGDVWELYAKKAPVAEALPLAAVVTIPASGSESSTSSVITNEELAWKQGLSAECIRPVFAILNPELTYTLPPYQTACGVADMLAHVMERYFTREPQVELTDELCEGTMRTIVRNARQVLTTPGGAHDYDARAELMWAGTLAHNNLLGLGRVGDWASHHLEHELSAGYDIAHGAGMAIIFPAWLEYNIRADSSGGDGLPSGNTRPAQFAEKVWGLSLRRPDETAREGVLRLREFYRSIGLPVSFTDAGLPTDGIPGMARRFSRFGPDGKYRKLDAAAAEAVYRLAC
ncbi:MAG: iron-containing alcohol dehydrogenase [Treponema sp.]|jgi:alcohol dehydrogenase YqhD (iron-dependent ADH family)|nr:iron-containing alcohol dehydrogenase [Treponema sp.]